ncbi:hypothetical protein [Nostoc sp. PCC 9305]|uniref:hypothetical protein n=1 Tax=Nostoc sp. PCC 9305 TaxID=296636 RepID=UPI0039C6D5AD
MPTAIIPKETNFRQNVSDSLITFCILGYPFFVESRMIPIDMKRLIKKTSNPVRKKTEVAPTRPPTDPIEMPESQNIPETVIEPNRAAPIEDYVSESEYISEHYRPLRSVGNSGWQPSDVWRELRVDNFCE